MKSYSRIFYLGKSHLYFHFLSPREFSSLGVAGSTATSNSCSLAEKRRRQRGRGSYGTHKEHFIGSISATQHRELGFFHGNIKPYFTIHHHLSVSLKTFPFGHSTHDHPLHLPMRSSFLFTTLPALPIHNVQVPILRSGKLDEVALSPSSIL